MSRSPLRKVAPSAFPLAVAITLMSAPLTPSRAEDARVLPQSRTRLSVILGQSASVSHTFDPQGRAQSLVAPYQLDLSSQSLRRFEPRIEKLVGWLNSTGLHYDESQRNSPSRGLTTDESKPKLGDALTAGALRVRGEGTRRQVNLVYQRGITDRLSVGVTVPWIETHVEVDAALTGTNTAEDIYQALSSDTPAMPQEVLDALHELRSLSPETFQSYLVKRGYQRFGDFHKSGPGDVMAGARFLTFRHRGAAGVWLHSAQLLATVPTGRLSPPEELTGVDFGQGAWDLGASSVLNYTPARVLTLSHSLHYTYRFPSSRLKRVRENPADLLPDASSEESVRMLLGNKIWTKLGAQVSLTRFLALETSYEWYWKLLDRYEGARPDRDYSYLSERTDHQLETFHVGAGLSSVEAFLSSDFPIPGELNVSLYVPIRGKNAWIAPYGTAELALFF